MPAGQNSISNVGVRRLIYSLATPQMRNFEVNGTQTYVVVVGPPLSYTYNGVVYAKGATIPFDGGAAPPASPAAAVAAGGTLAVGTYYYVVTAIVGGVETTQSAQVTATTTAGNQTINVTWSAVAGASGYKVYRTTTSGSYISPALAGSPAASPFADTGAALTAGAPPTASVGGYSNAAQLERDFNAGWIDPSN
jgi:hypothetical protein